METDSPKLELIPDTDPRLHTKAEVFNPLKWDELDSVVADMFKIMIDHDGMGLAAPQVGIMKRLFIMKDGRTHYVCINPRVVRISKETILKSEGCLSYPDQKVYVERPKEVRVAYRDIRGRNITKKFKGQMARCFMHELDHLDGVVMSDVGTLA